MNREIKFRAWDKVKLRFITTGGDMDTIAALWTAYALSEHTHLDDLELEQFTGLKDKNGKEIYEGDIVTPNGQEIGVVKWYEGQTQFSVDYSLSPAVGKTYYGLNMSLYLEVIGNIYENPELLK